MRLIEVIPLLALLAVIGRTGGTIAQEPVGVDAAASLEKSLVEAIARAEKLGGGDRARKEGVGRRGSAIGEPARSVRPPRHSAALRRSRPIPISCPTNTARAWWSTAAG